MQPQLENTQQQSNALLNDLAKQFNNLQISQPFSTQEWQKYIDYDFIYSGKWKQKSIVQSMQEKEYFFTLKYTLEYLPINQEFFQIIKMILRFYKLPILFMLKKQMNTLLYDQLSTKNQIIINSIMTLAVQLIGQRKISQLGILNIKKIKKMQEIKLDQQLVIFSSDIQYMNYIQKINIKRDQLYQRLQTRKIKQQQILEFDSFQYQKQLTFMQKYPQYQIKKSIKDIQNRYQQMKRMIKLEAEQAEQKFKQQINNQLENCSEDSFDIRNSNNKSNVQSSNSSLNQNNQIIQMQEISMCCRRDFIYGQLIQQYQSSHTIYHNFQIQSIQKYYPMILRDICGLLNSQGGCIFIGIKTDQETGKIITIGYTLTQKYKKVLKQLIYQLVDKCILPKLMHGMFKIQFVPLKDSQDGKYFKGGYVIKLVVRYGDRSQFYSYVQGIQSKKEYFSIRYEEKTKILTNSQDIYSIYKKIVLNSLQLPNPVHQGPCSKPNKGRLLYDIAEIGL